MIPDGPNTSSTCASWRSRQTLTLLTATRHADTSEAAVLADLLDPEARTG